MKPTQQELNEELRRFASMGNLEVVKYLVEQGADVRSQDYYALRWAAENGHLDVIEYLQGVRNDRL